MTRNSRVPAKAIAKSFAIDHLSGQGQSKKPYKLPDLAGKTCIEPAEASQIEESDSGGTSTRSSSSDDDADAEVSDDEDEEDTDGDALAPSGCAMNKHGNQAGRLKLVSRNDASSKKRRASSAGLESPDHNTKHAKTSLHNTIDHDQASDSDDEAYNGVDLVSDAKEEESDVEKFEEKDIINAEDGNKDVAAFAAEDSGQGSDDWEGFDIENNLILPDIPYFDEQYGRIETGIFDSESGLFQSASLFDDLEPPTSSAMPTPRRVRFKDPIPPPSDSSDIVSNDEDVNSLFNTNEVAEQPIEENVFDLDNEDAVSAADNSSGYETDYGDTTEEDEKRLTTRPQSLLRRPSLSFIDVKTRSSSSPAPCPCKMPGTPARYERGPRMGSWKVDPTKPCAMIDSTGDNMVIIPAKRPARINTRISQMGSTRTSTACPSPITPSRNLTIALDQTEFNRSDFSSHPINHLTLAPDLNGPSYKPPPSIFSSQGRDEPSGDTPPSVFLPMDGMSDFSVLYELDNRNNDDDDNDDDDEDEEDDDNDEDEALLNMKDFIDFGVDSSDDEAEEDEDAIARATLPTPLSTSPTVVPNQIPVKTPSPDNPSATKLLKHLDNGIIGSFRRGHSSHQSLHRPQPGPSLHKQAIKGGRHSAARTHPNAQKKKKLSDTRSSHAVAAKRRLQH